MAAYNVTNLLRGGHGTLELRQHAASLNGRRVRLWAKFCICCWISGGGKYTSGAESLHTGVEKRRKGRDLQDYR